MAFGLVRFAMLPTFCGIIYPSMSGEPMIKRLWMKIFVACDQNMYPKQKAARCQAAFVLRIAPLLCWNGFLFQFDRMLELVEHFNGADLDELGFFKIPMLQDIMTFDRASFTRMRFDQ